ncbi:hypothetical protein LEP1GSC103_2070 [Leptospira borgpetersenii serovar Javanica str. UI 09931]|uniref:Uncharacterized protein n=2 Tax=Leptospira borgpetersenii TaxID=174 RepID=A0ABN0I2Y9_LEPBO|nr:hypothetical protein C4Q31_15085 [Leptospira borgpetersenii serovar Ceylonica]EKP15484.1 hypothetical protein LEP1GSC128_0936 [Leptospira borgpetersenii str. 200801926]EKQ91623.1 hypothetical protein LEP1GSC101_0829 [Leptospira borgpetersenii str. UI 09149]EKQ98998.1 hypothetical protein LEP1GSC121_2354 [Leptospira borgpetersenii serovar Castellonis str. 200801910]EMK14426.1 hypothetical protein LEP1GSC066_0560 [Leptospira sp. serovar Kenya str. Sh9]EMN59906.1 hypothetical protein LEP1GSC09
MSQNLRKRFVESSATLVFFRTGSYVEKSKRIARKNFPNENDLKRNFIFYKVYLSGLSLNSCRI